MQSLQIFRRHSLRGCHLLEFSLPHAPGRQLFKRCQRSSQRKKTLPPHIERDALFHSGLRRPAIFRKRFRITPVKTADVFEQRIGEIPTGPPGGKPQTIREQNQMLRHIFGGIEILHHHRRRHHQRLSGVGKPLTRAPFGRKLASRIE